MPVTTRSTTKRAGKHTRTPTRRTKQINPELLKSWSKNGPQNSERREDTVVHKSKKPSKLLPPSPTYTVWDFNDPGVRELFKRPEIILMRPVERKRYMKFLKQVLKKNPSDSIEGNKLKIDMNIWSRYYLYLIHVRMSNTWFKHLQFVFDFDEKDGIFLLNLLPYAYDDKNIQIRVEYPLTYEEMMFVNSCVINWKIENNLIEI